MPVGNPFPSLIMPLAVLLASILAVSVVWAVFSNRDRVKSQAELVQRLPAERDDHYASSNKCQSCHPGEYHSWHQTYHRTMTQPATPESVLGEFDGTTVESEGLAYRVYRKEDEFWAEMPDPEEMMYVVQGGKPTPLEEIPRVHRRVVMTTGSHHYQTYWVTGDPKYGNLLQTLPLIYLIKDKQWIPREEGFMRAPDSKRMITQWNNHCINCHSTGGNPGLLTTTKEGRFNTQAAELGISCEACHGPAEEHIRANQNPLRRYGLHHSSTHDDTIVNPAKLDHKRSSQVCGQCHGVYIRQGDQGMTYASEGVQYEAGDDLHALRYYITFPNQASEKERWEDFKRNPKFFRERWWDDGTILAAGREYTAMSDAACFTKGEMSCLSCHSMHHSDPNDQLTPEGATSASCTSCHTQPEYNEAIQDHTFHAPASTGSNCLNCHMPHTSYALFSAIRSHSIRSPNVSSSANHGVPNACNLCHLDKTLAWTQKHLTENYGHEPVSLSQEHQTTSAALLWLLKGHAAQRVIVAWHVGWSAAQGASGSGWLAPFQAELLKDPYGVVRYVAHRSLLTLPGFEEFDYDFLADDAERQAKTAEAIRRWHAEDSERHGKAILLDREKELDVGEVARLLRNRDDRPVDIKE